MSFSPTKALLGFASLVGLIVPALSAVLLYGMALFLPQGLTVAAREIVDVEAREAVDVVDIISLNLRVPFHLFPSPSRSHCLRSRRYRESFAISHASLSSSALRQPLTWEIAVVLDACLNVQNACKAVPDPYQASILAALSAFFGFLLGSISLSNPSSSCLGAALSGLHTSTLLNFWITLTGLAISDVINTLAIGGVTALWALYSGPGRCLPSLISAILVAINTLIAAIIALVNGIATCTVCSLTSVLITAINTLVATLVATLGLI
ncbi:hypothetical protein K438DRAFT_1960808 [Mycena galopus ATCC 62051]|nr:hypothetical protein K438DRAFT_1960808 [Mycena galopus ATCC 62051]